VTEPPDDKPHLKVQLVVSATTPDPKSLAWNVNVTVEPAVSVRVWDNNSKFAGEMLSKLNHTDCVSRGVL